MRAPIIIGVLNFLSAWFTTAATRFIVERSYVAVALELAVSLAWWGSIHFCKDWESYRRVIPLMIVASLIGVALGVKIP